jgi:hypothetical protein
MNNGQLANPLSKIAKLTKQITSKTKKTEENYELLSNLEWIGSLYTTAPVEIEADIAAGELLVHCEGEPCWPGENVESMLIAAAKKNRLGQQFRAGVVVDGNWPLIYDGPKDIAKLMHDERFIDIRGVVVPSQKSRVQRTRPIFREWELKFTIAFLPSVVSKTQILEALDVASMLIGLSDFRPKFGRFEIISAT